MSDDEATLTVSASGPAIVETETDRDGVTVRETRETELESSFEVTAAELDEVGSVYRAGVVLSSSDVAQYVLNRLDVEDGETYRVPDTDAWSVTVSGRVDEYAEVALAAADDRRRSRSKVLTTAAQILDTFAEEYVVDERPLLALYDLVTTTETAAFDPDAVARRLLDESDDETENSVAAAAAETVAEEVSTDD
jgi:hypothetical protein